MAQETKYLGKLGLPQLIEEIKSGFAKLVHTHKLSEITDYTVDSEIKSDSENPVQNMVVKEALDLKVPIMRTVNGKTLEANINLDASDVGTMTSEEITSELNTKADAIGVAYIDIEDNENIEYEGTITGVTIELVDNLESTSTTSALTPNQGRILKGYIDELNEDVETLNSNKADKDVVDGLSSSINELNKNFLYADGVFSGLNVTNADGTQYRAQIQADGLFVIFKLEPGGTWTPTNVIGQAVTSQNGNVTGNIIGSSYKDVGVAFPIPFNKVPTVTVVDRAQAVGTILPSVLSVTNAGCIIRIQNAYTGSVSFDVLWIAEATI